MRKCRMSQLVTGRMVSFTPVFAKISPAVGGGIGIMPKLNKIKGAFEQ